MARHNPASWGIGPVRAYFVVTEILARRDAMEEAFGHVAPEVHHAIARALECSGTARCRAYDLAGP